MTGTLSKEIVGGAVTRPHWWQTLQQRLSSWSWAPLLKGSWSCSLMRWTSLQIAGILETSGQKMELFSSEGLVRWSPTCVLSVQPFGAEVAWRLQKAACDRRVVSLSPWTGRVMWISSSSPPSSSPLWWRLKVYKTWVFVCRKWIFIFSVWHQIMSFVSRDGDDGGNQTIVVFSVAMEAHACKHTCFPSTCWTDVSECNITAAFNTQSCNQNPAHVANVVSSSVKWS